MRFSALQHCGTIGRHFPDNDPAYEGADSIELLKKVGEMLEERMYLIENIDATVIATEAEGSCHTSTRW